MIDKPPIAVIGAGGHAKVVISAAQLAGYSVQGVYDEDSRKWGSALMGIPVIGGVADLENQGPVAAILAIGDNRVRKNLSERLRLDWVSVVHPRAWVDPSVTIGPGTMICAGVVIQPHAVIGGHVIVNTGATVDHDCVVNDYAHISVGVHLAGGVNVGEGAFMCIGSSIIPGCSVGNWSTVGAGGVVIRDLPDDVLAVGVPAKIKNRYTKIDSSQQ